MSITGKSVKSLRKLDLINQKSPAISFKKIAFAHKATLNDAGFNLTTMTPPTELTNQGFSQPSTAELASVSLQFYAKNLTLTSAARGTLIPFQDYSIGGNQQINFSATFGLALADEIFYGVIDPVAKTGSLIADTNFILKTGTLSAGATDFNVGNSWKTNINPNMQLGAVCVYLDGVLQFRNAGNATAAPSADGNYQEVDNGSGECTLIKFNIADNLNDRVCMVMSNAISVIRPDGSLNDSIEKIQGSLDAVISTVADLAGVATTNFNASPTTPQLKQYGDRVVALETNAAYENQANTWTVAQDFSTPGNKVKGVIDGSTVAPGYVGESYQTSSSTFFTTSAANILSRTLQPGVWRIAAYSFADSGAGPTGGKVSISTTSATHDTTNQIWSPITGGFFGVSTEILVNISSATPYYLVGQSYTAAINNLQTTRLICHRIA